MKKPIRKQLQEYAANTNLAKQLHKHLREDVTYQPSSGLDIDRSINVVHDVKLLGWQSRNSNRRYLPEGVRPELYENVPVNIDHPTEEEKKLPRAFAVRFGWIANTEVRPDGVYGDLYYNPRHPMVETFLWWAQNKPDKIGLSHNAFGDVWEGANDEIVESVDEVRSVDLVSDPATTSGLFESVVEEADPLPARPLNMGKLGGEKPLQQGQGRRGAGVYGTKPTPDLAKKYGKEEEREKKVTEAKPGDTGHLQYGPGHPGYDYNLGFDHAKTGKTPAKNTSPHYANGYEHGQTMKKEKGSPVGNRGDFFGETPSLEGEHCYESEQELLDGNIHEMAAQLAHQAIQAVGNRKQAQGALNQIRENHPKKDYEPLWQKAAKMLTLPSLGGTEHLQEPMTKKGSKIKANMEKEYGKKKGEQVFYASANKGTIKGVHEGGKLKEGEKNMPGPGMKDPLDKAKGFGEQPHDPEAGGSPGMATKLREADPDDEELDPTNMGGGDVNDAPMGVGSGDMPGEGGEPPPMEPEQDGGMGDEDVPGGGGSLPDLDLSAETQAAFEKIMASNLPTSEKIKRIVKILKAHLAEGYVPKDLNQAKRMLREGVIPSPRAARLVLRRLDLYEAAEALAIKAKKAKELCESMSLPLEAQTDLFMEELAECKTEERMRKKIEDRRSLIGVARSRKPRSAAGDPMLLEGEIPRKGKEAKTAEQIEAAEKVAMDEFEAEALGLK